MMTFNLKTLQVRSLDGSNLFVLFLEIDESIKDGWVNLCPVSYLSIPKPTDLEHFIKDITAFYMHNDTKNLSGKIIKCSSDSLCAIKEAIAYLETR